MVERIIWDNIPMEDVAPGMKRKIVTGEKLMIVKMWFEDGFLVPLHSHENEQISQCLKGKMHFWFGENKEEELILEPGDIIVIPAHLPHSALMIGEVEGTDSWAPPRQDWLDGTDDYLRQGE